MAAASTPQLCVRGSVGAPVDKGEATAESHAAYYRPMDNGPGCCLVRVVRRGGSVDVTVWRGEDVSDEPGWVTPSEAMRPYFPHEVLALEGVAEVWVGSHIDFEGEGLVNTDGSPWGIGNSLLVRPSADECKYLAIGWNIQAFVLPEPVEEYYSVVGSSGVPAPVAFTRTQAVNPSEGLMMSRELFEAEARVYMRGEPIPREDAACVFDDVPSSDLSSLEVEIVAGRFAED